jgi:hypothetical protein
MYAPEVKRVFPADLASDSALVALQRLASPDVGELTPLTDYPKGLMVSTRAKSSYSPISAEGFLLFLYVAAFAAFFVWENHGVKPIVQSAQQFLKSVF